MGIFSFFSLFTLFLQEKEKKLDFYLERSFFFTYICK